MKLWHKLVIGSVALAAFAITVGYWLFTTRDSR